MVETTRKTNKRKKLQEKQTKNNTFTIQMKKKTLYCITIYKSN